MGSWRQNPSGCIEEVRNGMTLVVTTAGDRVARVIPEVDGVRRTQAALDAAGVAWTGRRPKKRKPSVRLRGAGSISDIVRENRF